MMPSLYSDYALPAPRARADFRRHAAPAAPRGAAALCGRSPDQHQSVHLADDSHHGRLDHGDGYAIAAAHDRTDADLYRRTGSVLRDSGAGRRADGLAIRDDRVEPVVAPRHRKSAAVVR